MNPMYFVILIVGFVLFSRNLISESEYRNPRSFSLRMLFKVGMIDFKRKGFSHRMVVLVHPQK